MLASQPEARTREDGSQHDFLRGPKTAEQLALQDFPVAHQGEEEVSFTLERLRRRQKQIVCFPDQHHH